MSAFLKFSRFPVAIRKWVMAFHVIGLFPHLEILKGIVRFDVVDVMNAPRFWKIAKVVVSHQDVNKPKREKK
jgi:hypothetical protein